MTTRSHASMRAEAFAAISSPIQTSLVNTMAGSIQVNSTAAVVRAKKRLATTRKQKIQLREKDFTQ